jgi:hypothetical protein
MILTDLRGKNRNVSISRYKIDWNSKRASAPQYRTKQFLKEFWLGDMVCEEFIIPGSRLRVDLINFTKMIAVEVSGEQHEAFSKFFHKTRIGFIKSIKRDFQKIKWLELNKIKLIEIYDYETTSLNKKEIEKKFSVTL